MSIEQFFLEEIFPKYKENLKYNNEVIFKKQNQYYIARWYKNKWNISSKANIFINMDIN